MSLKLVLLAILAMALPKVLPLKVVHLATLVMCPCMVTALGLARPAVVSVNPDGAVLTLKHFNLNEEALMHFQAPAAGNRAYATASRAHLAGKCESFRNEHACYLTFVNNTFFLLL